MKKGLSRSALEQFIRCPRCFYQQRRLSLNQPSMVPLTLAVATDALLKNEFDAIRDRQNMQTTGPLDHHVGAMLAEATRLHKEAMS